jgi:hypothetical protein
MIYRVMLKTVNQGTRCELETRDSEEATQLCTAINLISPGASPGYIEIVSQLDTNLLVELLNLYRVKLDNATGWLVVQRINDEGIALTLAGRWAKVIMEHVDA